jgi:hypothetical protein
VAIMKESIFETMEDEKGNIDFRRTGGMSKRNVLRQFETILAREAKRQSSSEFTKQVKLFSSFSLYVFYFILAITCII